MDILFTGKEVRRYQLFGFMVVWGREGKYIPVNSKYPLLSK